MVNTKIEVNFEHVQNKLTHEYVKQLFAAVTIISLSSSNWFDTSLEHIIILQCNNIESNFMIAIQASHAFSHYKAVYFLVDKHKSFPYGSIT